MSSYEWKHRSVKSTYQWIQYLEVLRQSYVLLSFFTITHAQLHFTTCGLGGEGKVFECGVVGFSNSSWRGTKKDTVSPNKIYMKRVTSCRFQLLCYHTVLSPWYPFWRWIWRAGDPLSFVLTVVVEERIEALIDKQNCLPQALLGFDGDKTPVCCACHWHLL